MNLLMVGSGKGSFQIRGVQLGAALGARVVTAPSDEDLRWADVVVLVKRAGAQWAALVHKFGKPIVWDALDFWQQPAENHLQEPEARAMLQRHIKAIRPVLTIGATEAMAQACGGVYLPHHSWAGLRPTPAREVITTVCYEGNPAYLGRWRQAVEQECSRRGWAFVLNPPDLSVADILVAFRDGPWDGWICREWKSGVKVVNAMAAGRPLLMQYSAAVRELKPDMWIVESPDNLSVSLTYWASDEFRATVVERSTERAQTFTLESVAEQYRQILAGVLACAA